MTIRIHEREIDGVVFDIHGTLYGNKDEVFAPIQLELSRLLLREKENHSDNDILSKRREYIGLASQIGSWRRAYIALGGNESEYLRVFRENKMDKKLKRNKELIELIEQLHSMAVVGILSGGLDSMAEPICTQVLGANWRKLFETIVFDDTPNLPGKKSDSKAFLYTLQLMKVEPSRAAMVGDSLTRDILPAAALGMMTIYVGDKDGSADIKINRIEELREILTLA